MAFVIQRGKVNRAWLAMLYGAPGVGKTTFAAESSNPVFLDLERGTDFLDVARVHVDGTIKETIRELYRQRSEFDTLVIDSYTALEKLMVKEFCTENAVQSIEAFDRKDYGRATKEWRKKVVDTIADLRAFQNVGKNVLLVAHSAIRQVTDTLSQETYDRTQFHCDKENHEYILSLLDGCFFLRMKTVVDERKATGNGARVLMTQDKPQFVAKSRWQGLPAQIENPTKEFWNRLNNQVKEPANV